MMSRFSCINEKLKPYTPGEQPKDQKYIKLNTNENPFPPSPLALKMIEEKAKSLNLYSDPELKDIRRELSELYGIKEDECVFSNGSDDALYYAFNAFCSRETGALFADITYSFYPVFANKCDIPYEEIKLEEDFTIDIRKFFHAGKTIFIANPNAPTGIALTRDEIKQILDNNKDNVVVVDEAYVDFGGESCVGLIGEYDNLLVIQTFSKSRSLAGGRLGIAIGNAALTADLNTVRFSINPYNVNSLTLAAGTGALRDKEYMQKNCEYIIKTREYTKKKLEELDFEVLPSAANFLFARSRKLSGEELYLELKKRAVLIRHFNMERIKDFNRITIGKKEDMDIMLAKIKEIMEEKTCA